MTAPQIDPRLRAARQPWGVVHVKRSGGLFTACGIPAANWHVFWNDRFCASAPNACRACGFELVTCAEISA